MTDTPSPNPPSRLASQKRSLAMIVFLVSFMVVVYIIPSPYGDWHMNFFPLSRALLDPYSIKTFNYPPWTSIFFIPFRLFSENTGAYINACLNILVVGALVMKRKGDLLALVLTLTSYPFMALLANGNVEWIPALGFILQNAWGVPFVLVKPQSGFLAMVAWFQRSGNKIKFLIPISVVMLLSFVVWGNWIQSMFNSVQYMNLLQGDLYQYNLSLFPWTIPVGLGLVYYIFKYKPVEIEIPGILATLCFFPYFASQSLIILYALISVKHRRIALILWPLSWIFLFK